MNPTKVKRFRWVENSGSRLQWRRCVDVTCPNDSCRSLPPYHSGPPNVTPVSGRGWGRKHPPNLSSLSFPVYHEFQKRLNLGRQCKDRDFKGTTFIVFLSLAISLEKKVLPLQTQFKFSLRADPTSGDLPLLTRRTGVTSGWSRR